MTESDLFKDAIGRHGDQGPLYRQVIAGIGELIDTGRLAAGTILPPQRDLAALTGLSRVTIARAMDELVRAGKVVQRQGSGTYVAEARPRLDPPLRGVTSFSEDMARRGVQAQSIWIARGLSAPTNEEAIHLGLAPTDQVARLVRVRLANGEPIAIERASLPATVLPDPEAVGTSLYTYLNEAGKRPARAIQRITATNLTPKDAETLGALSGAAALKIERISYLASGSAMEFTRSLYRGDSYDIVTELK